MAKAAYGVVAGSALFLCAAAGAQQGTVQSAVPRLVCAGGPATSVPDLFQYTLTAWCSGAPAQKSAPVSGWVTNPQEVPLVNSCPHNALEASGTAAVGRACVGLPDGGVRLYTKVRALALAGYQNPGHCDGGNYCGASASAQGVGRTSFSVDGTQAGHWCLGVVAYSGNEDATRGYGANSHWFSEHHLRDQSWTVLTNPSGQALQLTSGATYLLDRPGTWTVEMPVNTAWSANMAEVSGQYLREQEVVFHIDEAAADGACPRPGHAKRDPRESAAGAHHWPN
jgi:hypothetical protein